MTDDDKIRRLPVANRRELEGELALVPPPWERCKHLNASFEVDARAGVCRCGDCGQEVSAMFVLEQLMAEQSKWLRLHARYQDEMARLKERRRTKCEHCGQITRISGR
jgi:hypothetical protein